jgi:ectoine hydroxylase-related dioxygenase (phytanoyl-CoA dioxygenase family)
MLGRFLHPDATALIGALGIDPVARARALEVVEDGYTVMKGAIPPEQCAAMIARFQALEQQNEALFAPSRNAKGHYPRIVNLHFAFPELVQLLTRNGILLATLDALFGAPVSLYTSLFYEVGSQQPVHRDTPVFATRPEYLYFGVTVYLEPADDENGCLEVLPGGHKIPELDREAMAVQRYGSLDAIPQFDNDIWVEYQNAVVAEGRTRGLQPRKLHVAAGDTVIWHPQLPHGGTPIRDHSRTRFSFVMHVTPEGVPVYHQQVFFAPSKAMPETARWGYFDVDGRKIADHGGGVSFGHQRNYHKDEFVVPHQPLN